MENNYLTNPEGINKLNPEDKALHEKLRPFIGDIDELQQKFVECETGNCKTAIRNEYFKQEQEAAQKFLESYQTGQITEDDFRHYVTSYSDSMLSGIIEGQQNNASTGGLLGDIYSLSGAAWTPAGMANDPYLMQVRELVLIAKMKTQGASSEQIETMIRDNQLLASTITPMDRSQIIRAIEGGISSSDFTAFASSFILNKAINKVGKGSPMPVPEPVKTNNGLNYQSNPKHTLGQPGNRPNAGIEPKNSLDLFNGSISTNTKTGQRYSIDSNGNVHRFSYSNDGTWHWSGNTGDAKNPLNKRDIPNDVKKQFNLPGKWR